LRGDPPLSTAARVFVALFVAVCLFWAAGLYAQTVGRDQAARLAGHLDELPAVTLSGNSDLDLNSPGSQTVSESVAGRAHTYSGLRLLAVADGTMWLLPQGWTAGGGRLFAVPEADATGLSFTPATVHLSGSASANNFSSSSAPLAGATAPAIRNVGPLKVELTTDESPVDVFLANRTKKTVSGVEVAGMLGKSAQPFVTGKTAFCKVAGTRFLCKVDAIPRGRHTDLKIGYRGKSTPHGKVTVTVGAAHSHFPLLFSG
ncbi:MAG TPA: hypothetical protein VHZ77_06345, partial [Gaiellaceae bacterium]|nr:hypothetical protein [Gaiellaceae bacterium]